MGAKSSSEVWKLLKRVIESDDSTTARDNAKEDFELLAMIVGESAREYVARAKGLAGTVRYHGIDVTDEEICRHILTGLPPV